MCVERARRWVEWERERMEEDSWGRGYAAKADQMSNTAKGGQCPQRVDLKTRVGKAI